MSNSILFIGGLGAPEVIILLILVVLLFGGKKIPELMRGVGKGINEFKHGVKDPLEDSDKDKK